jgi:transcriptional regulator with XRE-family HTH domain
MRTQSSSELGVALRAARSRQRRTQREVAAAAGVERSWLARLEGGAENPTFAKLVAVTSALGLHLEVVESAASIADGPRKLREPVDLDVLLARFDERP